MFRLVAVSKDGLNEDNAEATSKRFQKVGYTEERAELGGGMQCLGRVLMWSFYFSCSGTAEISSVKGCAQSLLCSWEKPVRKPHFPRKLLCSEALTEQACEYPKLS